VSFEPFTLSFEASPVSMRFLGRLCGGTHSNSRHSKRSAFSRPDGFAEQADGFFLPFAPALEASVPVGWNLSEF